MIGFHFLLIDPDNVKVKLTDLSATVLEPKDLQEVVNIETILICITFKKFCLCNYIVLSLFLLFLIYKVCTFASLMARLSKVWGNTNEILVTFWAVVIQFNTG